MDKHSEKNGHVIQTKQIFKENKITFPLYWSFLLMYELFDGPHPLIDLRQKKIFMFFKYLQVTCSSL